MVRDSYVEQCLERMREWMQSAGASSPTRCRTYLRCARQFIRRADKPLGVVKAQDVRDYLNVPRERRSRWHCIGVGPLAVGGRGVQDVFAPVEEVGNDNADGSVVPRRSGLGGVLSFYYREAA